MDWRTVRETAIFRYGFAVAMAALGLIVRFAMGDWFPPGFPYLTFFPAIIVTTYVVGARPAILCATLSGLAAWYFFIGPAQSFDIGATTLVALAFFAFVVAVDIFFIDGMRGAMRQLSDERERYARLTESQDLLYRELHHRVGDPVPFRAFAESLLNDASVAAGVQAAVSLTGGDQPLHPDQATPVTLVLLECFNNALEHAFVDGREGAVQVRLEQDGQEHVLTIQDNGAGPPEGFDPARSPSLGLRIVRAMAGQLGGRFEMLRGDGWTVCRLTYPARTG
jgi:two-component sensor histidine kinase